LKFSWVPGTFPGFGAADLWFDNFTKHPAYYGVVEALTEKSCKPRRRRSTGMSKALF